MAGSDRAAVSPGNLVGPETGILTRSSPSSRARVFSVTQRELLEARAAAHREGP